MPAVRFQAIRDNRSPINLRPDIVGPMTKFKGRVEARMKHYPSPPAGSEYRRTGTLGRRWESHVAHDGSEVLFGNPMPYAGFVQGDEQTQQHTNTGWEDVRNVVEDELEKILPEVEAALGEDS